MARMTAVSKPNKSAKLMRDSRTRLGLSRSQAAQIIGCTACTIGRYEREGISGSVRYSRVARLCEAYRISADHLCSLIMQPAE